MNCSIEGGEAFGVEFYYTGDAIIETFANETKWVLQSEKKIIVMSMNLTTPLTNLFNYTGKLKIAQVNVADKTSLINATLHRIENYSELMTTNAEDLTINSENLGIKSASGRGGKPREIKYPILENQDTENHSSGLYLEGGTKFRGKFHIHMKGGSAMTGALHTAQSKLLYYKPKINGRFIDKLIPTTILEAQKLLGKEKGKMRSRNSIKKHLRSKMKNPKKKNT